MAKLKTKPDPDAPRVSVSLSVRDDQEELLAAIKRRTGMGPSLVLQQLIDNDWPRLRKLATKGIG